MDTKARKAFTIFVGFLHDFAAGCWCATALAIFWLDRIGKKQAELRSVLGVLERRFFWAGIAAMAIVFIAGIGRTFTYAYIGEVYGAELEKMRIKMLIIKHIILITIFGSGTWWQYKIIFA